MFFRIITISLLCIFLKSISVFSQGTWTQKANFGGGARGWATSFTIGNKAYIGLGANPLNFKWNDLWEWDKTTNVWTQKANFPGIARDNASGFSIGTKGYIGIGGIYSGGPFYSDFWEWDQATNTWTQKANFPGTARQLAVGFSIGTKGYIGTGGVDPVGPFYADFWEWDQTTNSWTQKANFAGSARNGATGFSIGTKGYIGTGNDGSWRNDFWEWDQTTDVWTQKANYGGVARYAASSFAIGTKGYIGTGYNGVYQQDFWEWDQTTNVWTQQANFGGGLTSSATGFSIGSCGYIGTGGSSATGNLTSGFWEFCSNASCCNVSQCPIGTSLDTNLISNRDFSLGNTGFTTTYTYCNTANCLFPLGNYGYSIGTNANFYHNSFNGVDNTTGTGNFMIVNGSDASLDVWRKIIPVQTNSTYLFDLWICSVYPVNPAPINILINGTAIGSITAPPTINTWIPFSVSWNSGANTSANILIQDQNTNWTGTDYGLDDVSFRKCTSCSSVVAGISPSATICQGTSATLAATGGNYYSWNNGSSTSLITVSPSTNTTYSVIVSTTSCSDTTSTTITVSQTPTTVISGSNTLCSGDSATLTAFGGNFYSWSTGSTTSSVLITPASTSTYSVIASNANGCTGIDTFTISVLNCTIPVSAFSSVKNNICLGECVQYIDLSFGPPSFWQWNFEGGNPNSSAQFNPLVCYDSVGTYDVTLITSNSNSSDTLLQINYVTVADCYCPEIYLPNAFSPNDDNENDVLLWQGTKCVKDFLFIIYDRWGEKLFETDDTSIGWDGKYLNKKENSEVFTYYLIATMNNGTTVNKKGNISLIR